MTDDLVAQLREYGSCGMVFEAADRIEKLEAALREIIGDDELSFVPPTLRNIARKALNAE